MWRWSVSPENAPDMAEYIQLEFERDDLVSLDGEKLSPASLLAKLNRLVESMVLGV